MSPLILGGTLVAGTLGALLRYSVTRAFVGRPARLPWAVLIVNIVGSLVAGIAVAFGFSGQPEAQQIALSGFAGGLTTFSTFSTETVQLALERRARTAIVSVLANLIAGLVAFAAGLFAALTLLSWGTIPF